MIHDANSDQRILKSDRVLHLVDNSIQGGVSAAPLSGHRRRVWLGIVVVVALCATAGIAFVRSSKARMNEERPIIYEQATDVSRQLRSLTQSDLIQFRDGRIWYVRNVRGDNLEVVGWIGDDARIEDIPSFVLSDDGFRIVRQGDPDWSAARDRYLKQ